MITHDYKILQYLFFAFTLLFITNQTKAQLSPADSNFMNGLYDYPLYIDTSVYQGNWYINDTVASVYNHYLRLDTGFKFKQPILTVSATLQLAIP
jgi:hypothetical protein